MPPHARLGRVGTDLTSAEPQMEKVLELVLKAAATPATILILGENGTGKTVLARAIHENSPQKDNAFVTANCPSLSRADCLAGRALQATPARFSRGFSQPSSRRRAQRLFWGRHSASPFPNHR